MIEQKTSDVQSSYDRVAEEYVRHIYDELRHKPLDRQLLDRFADGVRGTGLACDSAATWTVARYLSSAELQCAAWIVAGMVEQARQLNPGIEFHQGDMKALDVPEEVWSGIAAFYAIVNLSPAEVALALREIQRVLQPEVGCC